MYKKMASLIVLLFVLGCNYPNTVELNQKLQSEVQPTLTEKAIIPTAIPTLTQPKGYVTLWFDDGLSSTYEVAYPELERRGWKGVFAVVSNREVAQANFIPDGDPVMEWNEVDELIQAGWEISSHSRRHSRLNEIEDEYLLKAEIIGSKVDLIGRGYSIPSFTFPYGENGLQSGQNMISQNYSYWRSSTKEVNPVPSWRHITSYALTTRLGKEDIELLVEKTEKSSGWLVLVFHAIVEQPVNESQHTREQFDMVLDVVKESSLEVVLPNEMFDNFGYAEGEVPQLVDLEPTVYDYLSESEFENGVDINIPNLDINTSLELVCEDENQIFDFSVLHESPISICISSSPYLSNIGAPGASIILGHRQWGIVPKVFAKLDKMDLEDTVIVSTKDDEFKFQVKEVREIQPDDLWNVIADYHEQGIQNEESNLILITCTPYGTAWRRLLVILERSQ